MRRSIIVISAVMMLMACGGKKSQTESTDTVFADSTVVDTAAVVVEKPYDFEAIAKAIEGCEYLENFSHGVARFKKDGQNYYIDLQGNIVEKPQVEENPDELSCDYENGKYGFKDGKGNVVIPHQFHFAHDFSDGMAIVVNETGEVGYINTKGELVIPYQYDTMAESDGNNFHEGLCAVVVDGSHEWVSYIDKTGKLAFEGVFSYGGDFSEGLAAVKTTGEGARSGYIDRSGKMVIELPDGWWGRKFTDGVAQTQKVDSCYIIDKTGRRLFKVNNDLTYTGDDIRYSEGLAVVYGKGKYEKKRGFMDKTGRITFCQE
ncbi:MAG: WG repeat-containing protein [Prevotella sp.]|nr:WG repeat-containing protein [Prevotella sp.]